MKLEWLETVAMVAKYNSFSEAAMEIPCAQSTVSRQVRCAEEALGVTLFRRSSNSNTVELTEEAVRLLPLLQRLLEDYEQLCQTAGNAGRGLRLVLGLDRYVFSSAGKGQLIGQLCLKYPNAELTLEELSRENQMEALMRGRIDAMLYTRLVNSGGEARPMKEDALLRWSYLGSEELCIAMSQEDPLANRGAIPLSALAGYTFFFNTDILRSYHSGTAGERSGAFIKGCLDAGFTPKICPVGMHLADVKSRLTAQGRGVYPSTVPFFLREYPGVRFVPLADPPHRMEYYVLSLKTNRNSGIRKLTAFLQEQFSAREKESPPSGGQ